MGGLIREIDYIAINAQYRNLVRKLGSAPNWNPKMTKNQYCRARTVKIFYIRAK